MSVNDEEELRSAVLSLASPAERAAMLVELRGGTLKTFERFPHLSSEPMPVPSDVWMGVHEADLEKWAVDGYELNSFSTRIRHNREAWLRAQTETLKAIEDACVWGFWELTHRELKAALSSDLSELLPTEVWRECEAMSPAILAARDDNSENSSSPELSATAAAALDRLTKTWRRFLNIAWVESFRPFVWRDVATRSALTEEQRRAIADVKTTLELLKARYPNAWPSEEQIKKIAVLALKPSHRRLKADLIQSEIIESEWGKTHGLKRGRGRLDKQAEQDTERDVQQFLTELRTTGKQTATRPEGTNSRK